MTSPTTKSAFSQRAAEPTSCLFDNWIDPIETAVRNRVRSFIEALIESELEAALDRPRYGRRAVVNDDSAEPSPSAVGHRHGKRKRKLTGTFGATEISEHGWCSRTVARRNGRAKPCAPTNVARWPPTR